MNSKIDKKEQFEKTVKCQKIYNQQEKELEGTEKVNKGLINKRETIRGQIIALSEKKRAAILNIERFKRERVHNETKIETIQNLKIDYEKNLKALSPTFFEQEKSFEKLKTVLDKKETEFKDYRSDLDSLLEKRFKEKENLRKQVFI